MNRTIAICNNSTSFVYVDVSVGLSVVQDRPGKMGFRSYHRVD